MENTIKARVPTGRTIAIGAGIVALILLAVGVILSSSNKRRMATRMPVIAAGAVTAGIPPIDAAAPANTDTATFALG